MFARTECLPGRNVCQDGMFAKTGCLPGRNVCRDGTFFILDLHKNVSTRDDFPQGKFAKLAKYRSGKAGRSVSPYCRDPATGYRLPYKQPLRGWGLPSLPRSRVSAKLFVNICFRLYERRASPPWRDLAIDYPRSRLGGLEIFHINALKRAGPQQVKALYTRQSLSWPAFFR